MLPEYPDFLYPGFLKKFLNWDLTKSEYFANVYDVGYAHIKITIISEHTTH